MTTSVSNMRLGQKEKNIPNCHGNCKPNIK